MGGLAIIAIYSLFFNLPG